MSAFHPDLRAGRFIPKFSFGPRLTRLMADRAPKPLDPAPGVTAEELVVPGPEGAPDVVLRVFRPEGLTAPAPALLLGARRRADLGQSRSRMTRPTSRSPASSASPSRR